MQQPGHIVLAADVGGTNTKLAIGRSDGSRVKLLHRKIYASARFPSLESVVDVFLGEPEVAPLARRVEGACFAVAGPVEAGGARFTNLSWMIAEGALAAHLRLRVVRVINDFAAAGLGIAELEEADFLTLQAGAEIEHAPRAVVGAGTGLGVAWLIRVDGAYRVYDSEAGHGDFAPGDAAQEALVHYLRGRFSHVSSERVLSGRGFPSILDFLRDTQGVAPSPALVEAMAQGDPAAAITRFALVDGDASALRVLDMFASAYGAFAGNMALAVLAHGGVYIAGGIAPRIAKKLADGTFMGAFTAKGRFRQMLETIPVKVVMNDHVGLYGALAEAARAAIGIRTTANR